MLPYGIPKPQCVKQNGRYFVHDIFKWVFLKEMFCILIQISLKFVLQGLITGSGNGLSLNRPQSPKPKNQNQGYKVFIIYASEAKSEQWILGLLCTSVGNQAGVSLTWWMNVWHLLLKQISTQNALQLHDQAYQLNALLSKPKFWPWQCTSIIWGRLYYQFIFHSNMGLDYKEISMSWIHVSQQRFSNLASDWLAAQLPANQKPC